MSVPDPKVPASGPSMDFEAELDRGYRLLLMGAVVFQFIVLLQGEAVIMALGWMASLICSALFLIRFFRARRQARGSMVLPVYMAFALTCWMFWTVIHGVGREFLGEWFIYFPFPGSLALVLVGAWFVFRDGDGSAGASTAE